MTNQTKCCTKCKRELPITCFGSDRVKKPDGLKNKCRDCVKVYNAGYRTRRAQLAGRHVDYVALVRYHERKAAEYRELAGTQ